tara:strand:- start:706 stop:1002 length:297 start_codon:yes stop_codon:yes gene_type:complete
MNKIIKQDYHSEQAEMSKEKKDFIVTKNKIKLMTFIQENNYLLINCDKEIKIYNSLRKLAQDIDVHPSGICKKLKISNYCTCNPKNSTEVYYIHNLKE